MLHLLARLIVAVALLVSAGGTAFAQERGRLPDGRAFRTDVQGNQLVDYIAELELAIEGLNRRVKGLESELEDKNRALERMQTQGSAQSEIGERNLLGSAELQQVSGNCRSQLAPLQSALSAANEKLKTARTESRDLEHRALVLEREVVAARELVANSNAEGEYRRLLDATRSDLSMQKAIHERQVTELEGDIEKLSAALRTKEQENAELVSRVESTHAERVRLEQQRAILATQLEEKKSSATQATNAPAPVRASFSAARTQALQSVRSSMLSELQELSKLRSQRDQRLRSYNQLNKELKLSPSKIVSSRNYSLERLRGLLSKAKSVRQLNDYRSDIRQLREKLDADLALIKRMS